MGFDPRMVPTQIRCGHQQATHIRNGNYETILWEKRLASFRTLKAISGISLNEKDCEIAEKG